MLSEEKTNSSMQIILHAGNARTHCMKALEAVESNDFELFDSKMKEAQSEIVKAHRIQTNSITDETNGKKGEYSVLFSHAQDTLMTVYSEINIAKRLKTIFYQQDKRITALETRLDNLSTREG